MAITGRNPARKAITKQTADAYTSTLSGADIARSERVEALRRMVTAGEYRVDCAVLAQSILRRALAITVD